MPLLSPEDISLLAPDILLGFRAVGCHCCLRKGCCWAVAQDACCLRDVCVVGGGDGCGVFSFCSHFLNAGGRGGSRKEKKTEQSPKSIAGQEASPEVPGIRADPGEKFGLVL